MRKRLWMNCIRAAARCRRPPRVLPPSSRFDLAAADAAGAADEARMVPHACEQRRSCCSASLSQVALAASLVPATSPPSHDAYAPIVSSIKSALSTLHQKQKQGTGLIWLNLNGGGMTYNVQGTYLVLLYRSHLVNPKNHGLVSAAFQRLKYLSQKYPHLNVFAMQCGSCADSIATQRLGVQTIIREFITYPIVLFDEDFTNMTNGDCYLLFEGSTDNVVCLNLNEEPETVLKAQLDVLDRDNSGRFQESKPDWAPPSEVNRDPHITSLRNLFLYYPGGVAVDEDGNRIFVSDSNHHRIIISNANGQILDSIGSSPGFVDAEFEFARFQRPAACYYHADDDCLYVADSENHAVRKVDLEKRTVQTVYPVTVKQNDDSLLSRILKLFGLKKEVAAEYQECEADVLAFPWHLVKVGEDDLITISQSFETSWAISMSTGMIREVLKGSGRIFDAYNEISKRGALLKDIYMNWKSMTDRTDHTLETIPSLAFVSLSARYKKYIVFSDTVGQSILKYDLETKVMARMEFSNFGALGLPYWAISPAEKIWSGSYPVGPWKEHIHNANVLPGRCEIRVLLDVPSGAEMASPLEETCVWRQVRGSAAEVSGLEIATAAKKVTVAQEWFDELDNLAFTTEPVEQSQQDNDNQLADTSYQNMRTTHFDCVVHISPGTAEVIVSAALYLRLQKTDGDEDGQRDRLMRLLDCRTPEDCTGMNLVMDSRGSDVGDVVFVKPVRLRLRLHCGDHPPGRSSKETILTESKLKICLSLD